MVAPAVAGLIGAGIGAGGNLISDIYQQQQSEDLFYKNWEFQREFAKNSLGWKLDQAKKYGINPLAALGASGSYASPVGVPSNRRTDFTQVGNAVGQALSSYAKKKRLNDLRKEELEIMRMEKELGIGEAGVGTRGIVEAKVKGDQYATPTRPTASTDGLQSGTVHQDIATMDWRKRRARILGQESSEGYESSLYDSVKRSFLKAWDHMAGIDYYLWPDDPTLRSFEKDLYRAKKALDREAGPNEEHLYDVVLGDFRLVPKRKGDYNLLYQKRFKLHKQVINFLRKKRRR